MKIASIVTACFAALSAFAQEADDFDRFYAGGDAVLVLPQGGGDMKRLGGGAARVGYYLTDAWALEGTASVLENRTGLSVGALWHWHGCEEFNKLFGYERLDPFFTAGARGWIGRSGQVGPKVGVGSFYHLSDSWSLRFDADATLGLDTRRSVDYTLSLGVQYSF